MNSQYPTAREGIEKMFFANIGILLCTVAAIVPFINFLAAIVAIAFSILNLIGLYKVGKSIKGCFIAFIINIVCIILSVATNIIGNNLILESIDTILSTLAYVLAIASIALALKEIGAFEEAKLGYITIAIYVVTNISSAILCLSDNLGQVFVGILLSVVAFGFYVYFLFKSKEIF